MKRGSSGLSNVLGINKPYGLSSHDVVNRCRRILGEKRIGHAGTLDPQAQGVLPILVGPAARLDRYLTGHDKTYVALIAFGTSTSTDDAEGEVIKSAPLIPELSDEAFAKNTLNHFLGRQKQIPPVYSAIKVNGERSYAASRKGKIIDLEPRDIEIYKIDLIDIDDIDGKLIWRVRLSVSKGTYIRAVARDIGKSVGVPAHLCGLIREQVGRMSLSDCVDLETLEQVGIRASLDPVKLLEFPVGFVDPSAKKAFDNGNKLDVDAISLFKYASNNSCDYSYCACTSGLHAFDGEVHDGLKISVVSDSTLKAIYKYSQSDDIWKPDCIFNIGVSRGLCV